MEVIGVSLLLHWGMDIKRKVVCENERERRTVTLAPRGESCTLGSGLQGRGGGFSLSHGFGPPLSPVTSALTIMAAS